MGFSRTNLSKSLKIKVVEATGVELFRVQILHQRFDLVGVELVLIGVHVGDVGYTSV